MAEWETINAGATIRSVDSIGTMRVIVLLDMCLLLCRWVGVSACEG